MGSARPEIIYVCRLVGWLVGVFAIAPPNKARSVYKSIKPSVRGRWAVGGQEKQEEEQNISAIIDNQLVNIQSGRINRFGFGFSPGLLLFLLLRCRCHGFAFAYLQKPCGKLTKLRASSRSVSASIFIALFGFFRAAKNLRLCPLSAAATPAICIVSAVIFVFISVVVVLISGQCCQALTGLQVGKIP